LLAITSSGAVVREIPVALIAAIFSGLLVNKVSDFTFKR
jgi:hypothetical protein